jgi:hypothetical protein
MGITVEKLFEGSLICFCNSLIQLLLFQVKKYSHIVYTIFKKLQYIKLYPNLEEDGDYLSSSEEYFNNSYHIQ